MTLTQTEQKSGLAWTSFGLGIGSVVASFVPLMGIISFAAAVAGIIVGSLGIKRSSPRWASITGVITSIVAIVLNVISLVLLIVFVIGAAGTVIDLVGMGHSIIRPPLGAGVTP